MLKSTLKKFDKSTDNALGKLNFTLKKLFTNAKTYVNYIIKYVWDSENIVIRIPHLFIGDKISINLEWIYKEYRILIVVDKEDDKGKISAYCSKRLGEIKIFNMKINREDIEFRNFIKWVSKYFSVSWITNN